MLLSPDHRRNCLCLRVVASVPRRYRLHQDAVFELEAPMIGSGTKLNIRDVGRGEPYDPTMSIDGSVAASARSWSGLR